MDDWKETKETVRQFFGSLVIMLVGSAFVLLALGETYVAMWLGIARTDQFSRNVFGVIVFIQLGAGALFAQYGFFRYFGFRAKSLLRAFKGR
jgi:hypothetical protein